MLKGDWPSTNPIADEEDVDDVDRANAHSREMRVQNNDMMLLLGRKI